MDVRESLTDSIRAALVELDIAPEPGAIHLERPANHEHGDWSSNVALTAAKAAGSNPRELATALTEVLTANPPPHVLTVEVAGPGFLNFRLADTWLYDLLTDVVAAGVDEWGRSGTGRHQPVIVEFVSANPTGPLHAGHGRGACFGDSVARLLERCGHQVTREFYINDRGIQMRLFADSLTAAASGLDVPEDGYRGAYVTDWAAELPSDVDSFEWGKERALADHREVLGLLDIEFDSWFSERSMIDSGAVAGTLDDLRSSEAAYEEDGALWLRSTDHGDDKDRVLVKSDGEYTYLLPDVAYHRDKFARASRLVNVWGADHHGYVVRLKAAMAVLGYDPTDLEVSITQMVRLERAGEEVRLSKRTGEMIELREVISEVGADAARFTYLLQSVDAPQVFDLNLVASQVNENPVFYVQYAHARIHSIVSRAAESGIERLPLADTDLSLLIHQRELAVLRSLHELPDVIARACRERAPHQVTTWVRDLAALFHGFYHDCRVIGEGVDSSLTQARLWLVEATQVGLVVALDLLGVSAPTEMWREEETDR
ncbi:MAG: arginine--tRNA ligase [Actinomycetota bacterium]|nr:arginine--tRNA ligase [Actinomycetota bacterium]